MKKQTTVLYTYRCKCGHNGERHYADDTYDNKTINCENCGSPTRLEWDGGVKVEIKRNKTKGKYYA